jgi:regulatory protein
MDDRITPRKKITDEKTGYQKAEGYCAYQERCQQEVRDKLYEWGLWPDAVEGIIANLIENNFLNEERFAKAFAGGKFRIKKWGRVKIRIELKKRKISDYCIKKGLHEIDQEEYEKTLRQVVEKKSKSIKGGTLLSLQYKSAMYAISRGYEPDMVWDMLKSKK